MEFTETHIDGGVLVIAPTGRLNAVAAPRLRALIAERVDAGSARVVLDLAETSFMDSSGLGAIIASLKKAREAGGDLRITRVPAPVMMILTISKVDRVLPVYPDPANAFSA